MFVKIVNEESTKLGQIHCYLEITILTKYIKQKGINLFIWTLYLTIRQVQKMNIRHENDNSLIQYKKLEPTVVIQNEQRKLILQNKHKFL